MVKSAIKTLAMKKIAAGEIPTTLMQRDSILHKRRGG